MADDKTANHNILNEVSSTTRSDEHDKWRYYRHPDFERQESQMVRVL
jgi:hypothetical protein